ncbi:MAG: sugar ABC transporter permease [Chloroflexi bacterium]|nr:sugar ABC transporter permease [Chloroflexota bacterium]
MLYSLFLVTQNWNMLNPPRFIGLDNVTSILDDPLVGTSLVNTAYYTFIGVPLHLLLAFTLAMGLNQSIRGLSLYRVVFYLPSITPAVASAVVWMQILNDEFGVLNNVIKTFGGKAMPWLFDANLAKPAFIFMSLWNVGPMMIIFLAGLQNVPRELMEAAQIDGAGAWQRFRYITVPIVSPVIFFNLVIGIIGSFQVFTSAYVMTRGGPENATLFMVLYVYNNGFQLFKMGYAATLAWLLFWIIMFFTFIQFRFASRWVYYESKR